MQATERDVVSSKKRERKKRRQKVFEEARLKEHPEFTTDYYRGRQLVRGARSNRFMLVRYLSAALFFLSVSWLTMLFVLHSWGALVPLFCAATSAVALVECMVAAARDGERLKYGEVLYRISTVVALAAAAITLVAGKDVLFPFQSSPWFGVAFCANYLAGDAIILVRLKKIREHTDKRYAYYERISSEVSESS